MLQMDELYRLVEQEYAFRRERAQAQQRSREEEIRQLRPDYARADAQRAELSFRRAQALLGGRSEEAQALEQELAALTAQKEAILKECGKDATWLEVPYRCALCKDTGVVDGARCRCFGATCTELMSRNSALWETARRETFETFDLNRFDNTPLESLKGRSVRDLMRAHRDTALTYTREFAAKKGNLLLTGLVGTGKTFLCNCIATRLMDQGVAVLYLTAAEYCDTMRRGLFAEDGGVDFEAFQAGAELLILDDLGTEPNTEFTRNLLLRTVNDRLLKGRPTILSTNLGLDKITAQYSERVLSRLMQSFTVLRFVGEDQRMKALR